MKTLFAFLVLFFSATSFGYDRTLICPMKSSKATPWYNFVITLEEIDGDSEYSRTAVNAVLSWYQYPFKGAEIVALPQTEMGLQYSPTLLFEPNGDIYIEWAGDGDAGYATLEKNEKGNYNGIIIFPNSGPEGYEDGEQIAVSCSYQDFSALVEIPKTDVVGVISEFSVLEIDPFILGDVCITYVRVENQTSYLAFVSSNDDAYEACLETDKIKDIVGKKVKIPRAAFVPVLEPSKLLTLNRYKEAHYFKGSALEWVQK